MKRAREAAAMRMFDGCTIQPLDRHAQNCVQAAAAIRAQQLAYGRRVLAYLSGKGFRDLEDGLVTELDLEWLLDEEGA